MNVTISLVRDETPERYKLSKELAEVLDVAEGPCGNGCRALARPVLLGLDSCVEELAWLKDGLRGRAQA